ncbi:GRAM domain-containing protein 2B-like isoform X2 [Acanthaster planci]|uniref:GRAM domain-containing protein 2B-like isoform X2 n=1 Tax=Acanthaster planci TaxID=133434 RepID=A0A8B7ZVK1_ACAPL|nr:GRAM domain-containing protein 2B-like isoform X2 [Acanthaster planci]
MEETVKETHPHDAVASDPVHLRPRSRSAFAIGGVRSLSQSEEGVEGGSPVKPRLHNRWSYEGIRRVSFSSDNALEETDIQVVGSPTSLKPSIQITVAGGADGSDILEADEAPSSPQLTDKKDSLRLRTTRSRSLPKVIVGAFSKLEEKSQGNRNRQYHKLFEGISPNENLVKSYPCALMRDILIQGRMFISANWICFYSNILIGHETKIAIPVDTIRAIFKMKYTFLVPSAISIHTHTNKHVFGSLLSRRATYKKLMQIWDGKSNDDDEEKSTVSHDGSYYADGPETSVTENQPSDDSDDNSRRSYRLRSGSRKKNSRREYRVPEDQERVEQKTATGGRLSPSTFMTRVKYVAASVRAKHLVLPLAILVICCLSVSSVVLSYRIARIQAQLQRLPDVAEALEWNRLLVASQSGHIDQISKIRDTLVLSLQLLNKMHSSLDLLYQSTTNTDVNSPPPQL